MKLSALLLTLSLVACSNTAYMIDGIATGETVCYQECLNEVVWSDGTTTLHKQPVSLLQRYYRLCDNDGCSSELFDKPIWICEL